MRLYGPTHPSRYPHERFTRSRSDSFSAKECNSYASTILRAKRAGEDPDAALEDHFCGASFHYTWSEYVRPDLETFLEQHGKRDTTKWTDEIRYEWEERAADADRSRASDLFDSHDRCELLFALTPTAGLEDHLIYSHKPWSEPAELSISPDLQFALNQIGYSINEFRRMSGNQHEATEKLHAKRPRRNPIVSQEKLTSIIANACSSMFNFYLFAIVPMTDLIKIGLTATEAIDLTRADLRPEMDSLQVRGAWSRVVPLPGWLTATLPEAADDQPLLACEHEPPHRDVFRRTTRCADNYRTRRRPSVDRRRSRLFA